MSVHISFDSEILLWSLTVGDCFFPQAMVKSLDTDKNGKISYDEFMKLMKKTYKSPEEQKKELMKAFRIFDKNKDGHISASELIVIMTGCGQSGDKFSLKEAQEMIKEVDKDKDGKINIKEFIALMTADTETLVAKTSKEKGKKR